jgi:protein-disulfide isomerase
MKAAAELGLDTTKFAADMASAETTKILDESKAAGQPYGIGGTPSFLINGVVFVGAQPIEKFKEVINAELARSKQVAAAKNLSGEALYQELVKTAPKPAPRPERQPEPIVTGRAAVDLSTAPALGPEDAPVTLVEFTDFECPFCSRGNTTIHQLMDANPGKIRLYFRHYPLPFHQNAKLAHQAAEAAKIQGIDKFWAMYDLLFANQRKADKTTGLDRDSILGYAQQIGLDMAKFQADLDSDAVIKIVEADIQAGSAAGVNGTPHFLLNGTELSGAQPLPAFQAALDKELEAAKPYIEKGLSGRAIYEQMAKDDPRKVVRRPAPEPPKPAAPIVLDQGNSPFKGAANAPVTIFQFSEFQCPFCSRVEPTLEALMNDPAYAGKIKIVFKHFPLGFHPFAQKAAEAALFAHDNGKFWELHKIMFENQKALDIDSILSYAKQVGLDADALKAALDSNKYADAVAADVKAGSSAGISGTPSFVINGKLFVGAQPIDNFKKEIDAALANAGK